MNIALFGGTFDPVHRGHVMVARAAVEKFGLKQVRFIPADIPPHKQKTPIRRTTTGTPWCRWRLRARRNGAFAGRGAGS